MADPNQVSSLSSTLSQNQSTNLPEAKDTSGVDAFMTQLRGQLESQSGIISSGGADIETQINKAIGSVTTGNEASTASLNLQYGQKEQIQATKNQQNLTTAQESQRGFASNTALLKQIQDTGTQAIADLEEQKQSLILAGQSAAASKIADLQVTQAQLQLQNRQAVFSNLVSLAGVASQQGQLTLSRQQLGLQQQQAEQELQGKMGTIALQYGIKVNQGDTIEDVVNRAAGNSKAMFDMGLQDAAASIRLKNAQASLALAQSASQKNTLLDATALANLAKNAKMLKGTPYEAAFNAAMVNIGAQNMAGLGQAMITEAKPRTYTGQELVQNALIYKNAGGSLNDYIVDVIGKDSSIKNQAEAARKAEVVWNEDTMPGYAKIYLQAFGEQLMPFLSNQTKNLVGVNF